MARLKSGKTISQPQAAQLFNYWRLSDGILKLRREGHDIITIPKGESGYAVYKLIMPKETTPKMKVEEVDEFGNIKVEYDESASWGGGPEPYEPNVYDGTYSEE